MLIIRKKQLETLRNPRLKQLHRDLLVHVKEHFQAEVAERTDQELLDHIRRALDQAAVYGLRAERDLYLFVNITLLYGLEFDRQDQTAWTREFLEDEAVSEPGQRLALLYDEIIHRLEHMERMPEIRKRFYGDDI